MLMYPVGYRRHRHDREMNKAMNAIGAEGPIDYHLRKLREREERKQIRLVLARAALIALGLTAIVMIIVSMFGCEMLDAHEDRQTCIAGNENACIIYLAETQNLMWASAILTHNLSATAAYYNAPEYNRYGIGVP